MLHHRKCRAPCTFSCGPFSFLLCFCSSPPPLFFSSLSVFLSIHPSALKTGHTAVSIFCLVCRLLNQCYYYLNSFSVHLQQLDCSCAPSTECSLVFASISLTVTARLVGVHDSAGIAFSFLLYVVFHIRSV